MTRLIDADELISELEDLYKQAGWDNRDVHFSLADTICNLDMIPTVEVEPVRHGHWIMEFENDDGRDLMCSECRMKFYVGKGRDGNYCPNCGTKMDERKEE